MDYILIVKHKNRFWQVADVYKNDKLLTTINRFYEVTDKFIIEYDVVGGSGTGYNKGNVITKIDISNCILTTVEEND